MKKIEYLIGFTFGILLIILGKIFLSSDILFFRFIIGIALGYTLSRGYTGFAGSVNRAYHTGSTRLMRTMMMMFFITSLISVAFFLNSDITTFDLRVHPINFGLLAGGLLFGFGMTFSSCCASGVLTDFFVALPRGIITLIFFCVGVFFGFPIQKTASWVQKSWFSTEVGSNLHGGVYFPDLFKFDGLHGYLGAILLTGLLCGIVIWLSYRYEIYRKENGSYTGHFGEKIQDLEVAESLLEVTKTTNWYERLFVNAFSLRKAAIVISALFIIMLGITKSGWSASTPYGLWFGQFLMIFGVSAESISNFTHVPVESFTTPFFSNQISTQNFGILLGAPLFLLTSGNFSKLARLELKINLKQATFYALGGLLMGFGTRLANGCNLGALYTPIVNFSLSGWIFLIFIVIGGIFGNKLSKKINL